MPFGGVLSENAGDLLKEDIFGLCGEGFGFGSTGRASVGVLIVVAGRSGEEDFIEGEVLREKLGAGIGWVGDLDRDDEPASVRSGCEMDGNIFLW